MFYKFGYGNALVEVDGKLLGEIRTGQVKPTFVGMLLAWIADRGERAFKWSDLEEDLRPLGASDHTTIGKCLRALEDIGVIEREHVRLKPDTGQHTVARIVDTFHVKVC